jgi:hypothetical protein
MQALQTGNLQVVSLIPQAEHLRTSLVKSMQRLVPLMFLLLYFFLSFSVAGHITFGSASLRFVSLSSSAVSLQLLAIAAQLTDSWNSMRQSLSRNSPFAALFFLTFEFVFFWFLNAVVLSIVVSTYMHSLAKHNETQRLARRWADDSLADGLSSSANPAAAAVAHASSANSHPFSLLTLQRTITRRWRQFGNGLSGMLLIAST